MFACGLLTLHCRVLLFQWGLSGVDVSDQVKLFDAMRLQLRTLVPVQACGVA
jgi:hypothetical protein